MNINLIEYNKPTFYLDYINYHKIESYQSIDNLYLILKLNLFIKRD